MKIHSLDPFVLILPLPLLLRVFGAVIEKYLDATKRTGEGETFFSRDKFRTVYGLYIYLVESRRGSRNVHSILVNAFSPFWPCDNMYNAGKESWKRFIFQKVCLEIVSRILLINSARNRNENYETHWTR